MNENNSINLNCAEILQFNLSFNVDVYKKWHVDDEYFIYVSPNKPIKTEREWKEAQH